MLCSLRRGRRADPPSGRSASTRSGAGRDAGRRRPGRSRLRTTGRRAGAARCRQSRHGPARSALRPRGWTRRAPESDGRSSAAGSHGRHVRRGPGWQEAQRSRAGGRGAGRSATCVEQVVQEDSRSRACSPGLCHMLPRPLSKVVSHLRHRAPGTLRPGRRRPSRGGQPALPDGYGVLRGKRVPAVRGLTPAAASRRTSAAMSRRRRHARLQTAWTGDRVVTAGCADPRCRTGCCRRVGGGVPSPVTPPLTCTFSVGLTGFEPATP